MTDGARLCRCALCGMQRSSFHCGRCVRQGNFMHSAATPERFAEKQSKLMEIKDTCKEIEKSWSRSYYYRESAKRENINIKINSLKQKIAILTAAVKQQKEKYEQRQVKLNELNIINEQYKNNVPVWIKSVEIMKNEAMNKCDIMKNIESNLATQLHKLHIYRISRLNQLVNNVFPIKILSTASLEKDDEILTEQAIAEALQPATDSKKPTKLLPIQILTIMLPADGNYTAYCDWVFANKRSTGSHNNSSNLEFISRNQAYRLSAGLAYSTQLLLNIAYYLDIKLPHSINYGDFCCSELEERKFKNLVIKLHQCAIVILNRIILNKLFTKVGVPVKDPPLHVLLKLCPLKPVLYIQDTNVDYNFNDDLPYFKTAWWSEVNMESLQLNSDDEEPVCLNWDPKITETEVIMSSSPKGFSESILSLFRPWK